MQNIDDQIDELTANAEVFARAKPSDKITIVRSLQRQVQTSFGPLPRVATGTHSRCRATSSP
jgi:hypothetical protein